MNHIQNLLRVALIAFVTFFAFGPPTQTQAAPNIVEPNQFSCTDVTEIPQIECEALVALYNGTAGPNWQDATGWLVTNTPCSWYGVTCNHENVIELRLQGSTNNPFGLRGTPPPEIGNLTNLALLDLSANQLSNLPTEIKDLTNLNTFDISANQFSRVPPEVWHLTNLNSLDLSANQLSSIPIEVGNLTNLTTLRLRNNQLNNLVYIGNLTNLTLLDLSANQFSRMPPEVWHLTNLHLLDLSSNLLSNLPIEIGNLTNLTTLFLYSNRLNNLPISLTSLVGLKNLDVSDNHLVNIDAELRTFLDGKNLNWADSQTESTTATPVPINIPSLEDGYESDDSCPFARQISTDGIAQRHTFHEEADTDWVYFRAPYAGDYQISVEVPYGSPADVDFAYYMDCENGSVDEFHEGFTPGVQLTVQARAGQAFYMELLNFDAGVAGPHVAYKISVHALSDAPATGAVIIVAGRLRLNDTVQENIHNEAQAIFDLFQGKGVIADDVHFLATDSMLRGYDKRATLNNLKQAITEWAVERVSPEQSLTLYIISHGIRDELYIDKVHEQILTPRLLDEWLTELEEQVPGVKSNIILEACHSGSFISLPQSISSQNRVIISSASEDYDAYTSLKGAYFTDAIRLKLGTNNNLAESFEIAESVVNALFPGQQPWIDGDGDSRPNEHEDKVVASTRSFQNLGSLSNNWPPFIASANGPSAIADRRGRLHAEIRDNEGLESVWAIVYPPDYTPPIADGEFNAEIQDIVTLQHTDGNAKHGDYYGDYLGFSQSGTYRVIIQAADRDGLQAQPVLLEVKVEADGTISGQPFDYYQLYLPTIRR